MIRRGQMFRAPTYDDARITVRRVARDAGWADIEVQGPTGAPTWRKRQKLRDGRFPFPVVPYSAGAGSSSAGSAPPAPPPAAR